MPCREEIAAAGTKEMWLEPQIEKVPVSVLNDIGQLIQADAPKARRGKEVAWKHCWNPLDYSHTRALRNSSIKKLCQGVFGTHTF